MYYTMSRKSYSYNFLSLCSTCWEKNIFDDIKGIIRRCKSKNVREYNNQEKRAKIGKQCSAKEARKSKKT
jgi:hypothetical protein